MSERVIKFGIIGYGNAGRTHAAALRQHGQAQLAAICTTGSDPQGAAGSTGERVRRFSRLDDLLASRSCDAVIICTPHELHPQQVEQALAAGQHVLCEKPLGISAAQARGLVQAAETSDRIVAVNYPRRQEDTHRQLYALLRSGGLGRIQRFSWTATEWYRPAAYYAATPWRGTWAGEGGGVLLNQAIHSLDLLHGLFGSPARVRGFCGFGRHHAIEVEDEATAYLEYAEGFHGVFTTSTGEWPGVDRLEISGSRGQVTLVDRILAFRRNQVDLREHVGSAIPGTDMPAWDHAGPTERTPEPPPSLEQMFAGTQRNFIDAIMGRASPFVDARTALASLELANAIVLSTWRDAWVDLPMAGGDFESGLQQRRRADMATASA